MLWMFDINVSQTDERQTDKVKNYNHHRKWRLDKKYFGLEKKRYTTVASPRGSDI